MMLWDQPTTHPLGQAAFGYIILPDAEWDHQMVKASNAREREIDKVYMDLVLPRNIAWGGYFRDVRDEKPFLHRPGGMAAMMMTKSGDVLILSGFECLLDRDDLVDMFFRWNARWLDVYVPEWGLLTLRERKLMMTACKIKKKRTDYMATNRR